VGGFVQRDREYHRQGVHGDRLDEIQFQMLIGKWRG
jgi:hypothetical protein